MEDDLLPNESSYYLPREPRNQRINRAKEHANTLESVGVLKTLLERWDKKIAFYESVWSIPNEVKLIPEELTRVLNINLMIAENLKVEKEFIESLIETQAPNAR